MSDVIMCVYIGAMAFCAVALGVTVLIVGFMLGIEQMKKKLAEKDKEIERLKAALSDISKIAFEEKIGDKVARATMRRIADYTLTGKDTNVSANAPDTNVGTMEEKK